MTSRRPPCAVSLVGDNFALLSGRRWGLPGGFSVPGAGRGDAAECDGTSRPRVKREKPATATRTVTRLPPFLPPGVPTGLFEPVRRITSQLTKPQLRGGFQTRVRHHVPRASMITEARLARAADATGFTPWATGSR